MLSRTPHWKLPDLEINKSSNYAEMADESSWLVSKSFHRACAKLNTISKQPTQIGQ